VTEDEKAIEIGKILTEWNPVGDGAAAVNDLNNYESEAMDILWVMELYGYSPKKAVSEVLQEAFLIDLEKKELEHYSNRIKVALAK
jgi:hypothetical protein